MSFATHELNLSFILVLFGHLIGLLINSDFDDKTLVNERYIASCSTIK